MEGGDQLGEAGRVHEDHAGHEFEEDHDDGGESRQADAADARAFADDFRHWTFDQEEVQEHAGQRDRGDQHGDEPRDHDGGARGDLLAILGSHDLLELGEGLVDVVRILGVFVMDLLELLGHLLQARRVVADGGEGGSQRRQAFIHGACGVLCDVLLDLGEAACRFHRWQRRAEGAFGGVFEIDIGKLVGAGRQPVRRLVELLQHRPGFLGELFGAAAHALFKLQHAVLQLIGAERCDLLVGDGARLAAMVEQEDAPAAEQSAGDEEDLPEHAPQRLAPHPHQQDDADNRERQRPAIGDAQEIAAVSYAAIQGIGVRRESRRLVNRLFHSKPFCCAPDPTADTCNIYRRPDGAVVWRRCYNAEMKRGMQQSATAGRVCRGADLRLRPDLA